MFCLVPFCAGFGIALVTRKLDTAWAIVALAGLLASLLGLGTLVVGQYEGLLCAVLAFPLLAASLGIGTCAGYLFRRYVLERVRHQITSTVMLLSLTPALILAGHRTELSSLESARHEIVTDSIFLPAQPEEVWLNIQSIDSIDVRKPLLMYFGLPIPQRCTLDHPGTGAKRTCYFDHGFIEETITEWSPHG